eukprot:15893215-Heterocapsa_arctica.AAC.1
MGHHEVLRTLLAPEAGQERQSPEVLHADTKVCNLALLSPQVRHHGWLRLPWASSQEGHHCR